jgi:hypothetical protein
MLFQPGYWVEESDTVGTVADSITATAFLGYVGL